MRTSPVGTVIRPQTSRSTASSSSIRRSPRWMRIAPASVSATPLPWRVRSSTPNLCSRRCTRLLSDDCAMRNWAAAFEKLLSFATTTKAFRSSKIISGIRWSCSLSRAGGASSGGTAEAILLRGHATGKTVFAASESMTRGGAPTDHDRDRGPRQHGGELVSLPFDECAPLADYRIGVGPEQVLLTYECNVDNSGEESGFVYVSQFRTVAQLQRSEIERAGVSKQGSLFACG